MSKLSIWCERIIFILGIIAVIALAIGGAGNQYASYGHFHLTFKPQTSTQKRISHVKNSQYGYLGNHFYFKGHKIAHHSIVLNKNMFTRTFKYNIIEPTRYKGTTNDERTHLKKLTHDYLLSIKNLNDYKYRVEPTKLSTVKDVSNNMFGYVTNSDYVYGETIIFIRK